MLRVTKKGTIKFDAPVLFDLAAKMHTDKSFVSSKECVDAVLAEVDRLGREEFDRQLNVVAAFVQLVKE